MNSLFDVVLSPQTVLGNPSNASRGAEAIPFAALFSQFGNASISVTGIAGTNTITGTSLTAPPLANGQIIFFIPAATNTGATTFNRDSLGAKNIFANGAALVGGELRINVPALLFYDGTQYNLFSSNFTATVIDSIVGSLVLKGAGVTALTITGANSVFAGSVTALSLAISAAVGKLVPGATSFSLRNNADNADNFIVTDAGNATLRGALTLGSPIAGSLTAGSTATQNPFATGTKTTQAHGLGAQPTIIFSWLENITGELGYSAGDRIYAPTHTTSSAGTLGYFVEWDATNVNILSDSGVPTIPRKDTLVITGITAANWKAVAVPYKLN